MPFSLTSCLLVSALLFCFGVYTVLTRRNAIGILIGIELVLNAAGLNFVAFARFMPTAGSAVNLSGHVFTLFIISVAAAVVAVALVIVLSLFLKVTNIDVETFGELKG